MSLELLARVFAQLAEIVRFLVERVLCLALNIGSGSAKYWKFDYLVHANRLDFRRERVHRGRERARR